MSKIAIATDSNSGITQSEGKEMGVSVIPMPFLIDDKEYYEDIDTIKEALRKEIREIRMKEMLQL